MTKPEKFESRPVIVLDCFLGEGSYEDWIDKSMAEINHWNDEQKLMWLKVCLTGRTLMAFKKFPVKMCNSYKSTMSALCGHFELDSQRDLRLAEFQTRFKRRTESWPEFREDLRVLVDKAYPSLDHVAWQQMALQKYLSRLDNKQVTFNVSQRQLRLLLVLP